MECNAREPVTGPTAYLVDLMKALDSVRVNSTGKTVLRTLLDRRPDLERVGLTCAKTDTKMLYIDLANEVMESFISVTLPLQTAQEHSNIVEESSDDILAHAPRYINRVVYETMLENQVYPMEVFPYNYAVDCLRSFATSQRTTLAEMRRNLISPQRVLSYQISGAQQSKIAESHLRRAVAAETLGLSEEDFTAITGEHFQPPLSDDTPGTSSIDKVPLYWGYANEAAMLNQTEGHGLSFVREFLRRAGLSLAELVDILQTQYVGGRLLLTTEDEHSQFSNRSNDLRLCFSKLMSPTGDLDVNICDELQAFMRLRRKLGWSTTLLDAAWSCLAHSRQTSVRGIPAEWIEQLAAMKRLTCLSGIELYRILPLWADMDTNGDQSLYAQLFISGKPYLMQSLLALKDKQGRYLFLTVEHTLSKVSTELTAALRITPSQLASIVKSACLSFESPLTSSNLNAVYRVAIFCEAFSIACEDYEAYCSIFGDSHLILESPIHTLALFQQWRDWTDNGWTLPHLATVLHGAVEIVNGALTATITSFLQFVAADVGISAEYQIRVFDRIKSDFPGIDASILKAITTETIDSSPNFQQEPWSIMDSLTECIQDEACDAQANPTGYFSPPTDDLYKFHILSENPEVYIMLDGVALPLQPDPLHEKQRVSSVVRLLNGQSYRIQSTSITFAELNWSISTTLPMPFSSRAFVSDKFMSNLQRIYQNLHRLQTLLELIPLDLEELEFFLGSLNLAGLDLNALSRLLYYHQLRQGPSTSSLSLLKYLNQPEREKDIASVLGDGLGINSGIISEAILAKYPSVSEEALRELVRHPRVLLTLRQNIDYLKRIRPPGAPTQLLFDWAFCSSRPKQFQVADQLRILFVASNETTGTGIPSLAQAEDTLRQHRREALISYLLQQSTMRTQNIIDSDSLFEHFLIDINIDSMRKTSRIQNAIATIQLYVERCLLGMEANHGIGRLEVKELRKLWTPLQKYTL
ncbi:uncharacterized protein N7529_000999 [Penicillium soppii]|uniref:uncharacterized protein n=1 Tax=Penicillium soppii TaxID=69789 RepID=UPI002548A5C8|nr:uncharacterized protein N7529_000999 [Penicillium soppii]KAJ5882327.1 hypothetical protein N7529_000999 [Penicillium soppii]